MLSIMLSWRTRRCINYSRDKARASRDCKGDLKISNNVPASRLTNRIALKQEKYTYDVASSGEKCVLDIKSVLPGLDCSQRCT